MSGRPSAAQLRSMVGRGLEDRGDGRQVHTLLRRPSAYGSSLPIEDVDVTLDDGTTIELVLKDLSPRTDTSPLPRPDFAFDPRCSVRLHRQLLDGSTWGTPEHWASVEQPEAGRFWLLLERVEGVPLDEAAFDGWSAAARWLGRFHHQMTDQLGELAEIPIADYRADAQRAWMQRALMIGGGDPGRRPRLQRLAAEHEFVVERISSLPVTLVHGDFHASNILFDAPRARVCVLDWEMAGLGAGLLDLAALVSGEWAAEQRQRLVASYVDAVGEVAGAIMRGEELTSALAACRVQHAIQWLGWSPAWLPPPDQARDWLAEAEGLMANVLAGENE